MTLDRILPLTSLPLPLFSYFLNTLSIHTSPATITPQRGVSGVFNT